MNYGRPKWLLTSGHAPLAIFHNSGSKRMYKFSSVQPSGELSIWLRSHLSPTKYRRLARTTKAVVRWWNTAVNATVSWRHRDDLNYLASFFGTDKWGAHWYTQHYRRYFAPLRYKRLNILEIGVGGYDNLSRGAASLRMWKAYFRKSRIVGIDIYDKSSLN